MNTSIQHPEPNAIFSNIRYSGAEKGEIVRLAKTPGRFTWAGLLSVVLLFVGAPMAHAHRSPAGCTGSGLGISLFTSVPDVHIGDTIHYSALVFNSPFPTCDAGETNATSAGAIRAFIVTPDGVTNQLTLRRTFLAPGDSDFYTNVISYVVRSQDIRPDGTLRAAALDQGDIHQSTIDSRGGGFQGVNTPVDLPCVQIAANCVGGVGENGAITFTGSVTNCGNTGLVGVIVTISNDRGSFGVAFPTNLDIGQAASFSGSWVPLNPCLPSTAILTVVAIDELTAIPKTLTNSTTITCQNTLTPGIKVTTSCLQPALSGQLLTYSGSVSNTGNVTLTNIVVVGSQPAPNTPVFTLPSLAPGAATNFTGSYTAPANCASTHSVTANASSVCGAPVTSSDSATCPILTTPAIKVTVNCSAALLTYSGTVTNTGDITLTNIVVVSDQPAANTIVFTLAALAPGAGTNYTGSYTVAANSCGVTTTVSATGKDLCTGVAVTNTASATCTIVTAPAITVTLVCPAVAVAAGGQITYSGTVRNSGNVALDNVTVVDNQATPGTVLNLPTLAAGASANFTVSFTAPADTCSVSSTVTATGKDHCTSAPVSNSASATCPLVTTPGIVVTPVCPTVPATPGGLLSYSGTVRNAGNVMLTNIVVLNNLSGATPVFTSATLAPGETRNFSGSYSAPTNCASTSTSTATGQSICGVSVTNSATLTCPVLTAPQVAVTAVCPSTPTAPGAVLTYTGTVRNPGNITLTNIVVVSDRPAANTVVFTAAALAPGASAAFTGSYTVPTDVCPITANIKVTGKDQCAGSLVTDTFVSTCTVSASPAIAVTLACPTGNSGSGINIALNQNATQSSTYVNNGFSDSADLAVDGDTSGIGFNKSVAITTYEKNGWWQVDLGSVRALHSVNVWGRADTAFEQSSNLYVFVSDTPFTSGSLSDTLAQPGVTSFYTPGYVGTPGVYQVNRTGRYVRVQSAQTGYLALAEVQVYEPSVLTNGNTLTYTGTVKNTGNVTLNNVTVVNSLPAPGTVVFTVPSLAPGISANFTAIVNAPSDTCSISSTVTATGKDNCTNQQVTNSATATCVLPTEPGIAITQVCGAPGTPGGPLTYGGTVHNTGNVTLTNVTVFNNLSGATPVFTAATLAPGETASFTGSYLAPTNCSSTSTSTATGRSICGVSVTNSVTLTCPVVLASAIEVTQTCPPNPVLPGDTLTYKGTVHNSGNITLTNVVVVSDRPASNTVIFTVATLAPGATANFTGSYQVPLNCCVSSSTVEATGKDICAGITVVDSFTATCTALTVPKIVVTKVCPSTPAQPGDVLHYSGSVSNAGNVALVDVTIVNSKPTAGSHVLGPIALAPGESVTYYASYLVPTDFCGTDVVTAQGLDACTLAPVANSVTTTCPIITTPRIFVTKNCPPQPTPRGGLFTFTGSVSNAGNVTLTNVLVVNNYEVDCFSRTNGPVIGPITLVPGASVDFTNSYLAPRSCCEVVDTLTASGQDGCGGTKVTATATAVCPLLSTPGISVSRVCPASTVPVGGLFVFTGSVTNTGDVVLTNVMVFSSQPNANTPLLGPIELAPGESEEFKGSYTVTAGSNPATDTVTARGTDTCQARTVSAVANCSGTTAVPTITSVLTGDGVVTITWTATPGKTYCLQHKAASEDSSWVNIPGNVTATSAIASKSDNLGTNKTGLYRIMVVSQ